MPQSPVSTNGQSREEGEGYPHQDDACLSSCPIFFERPPGSDNVVGNITPAGLNFIARHRYKPAEYTHLDNLLNPVWTSLTELLPMWLAPNMVTTLGGLHCAVAYGVLWHYSPDMDASPPDWAVLLAGWCTIVYYTLDCMDGKQARRTGSSSPLGQLFDHGFDCMCTIFLMSTVASYLMIGGTYWYLMLQTTLQFAFFMAQWEEYHTHVLPHCTGKWLGVTEVNYFMGSLTTFNSFIDREAAYLRPMRAVLAPLAKYCNFEKTLPAEMLDMEARHFYLSIWAVISTVLMTLSVIRVLNHANIAGAKLSPADVMKRRRNALLKLVTPAALCAAMFFVPTSAVRTRYVSVAFGLAISLLTKKMIVFSMAKMPYAVVQWDAIPFLGAALWIKYDGRLTREGADFVLGTVCVWYAFRVLRWGNVTINQICEKLDIYCFSIKHKKGAKSE